LGLALVFQDRCQAPLAAYDPANDPLVWNC
jgi:hypothetical protein